MKKLILFVLILAGTKAEAQMFANRFTSIVISNPKPLLEAGVLSYDIGRNPSAVNYYVDATNGNDSNTGTSDQFAWKTLSKVNSANYVSGDKVYFKRGQTWFGSLIVNHNDMTFDAYGSSTADPVITGFQTVSSWTSAGGGIYYTIVDRAKPNISVVTLNGTPQQIGRYPNADAINGGYLDYTGGIGTNKIYGVSGTGFVGKWIIIKKNYWREENVLVTAQNGDTLTFAKGEALLDGGSSPLEGVGGGNGYYFYNSASWLDQLGEFHFDSATKRLSMFFGGGGTSGYTVKVAVLDTLVNMKSFTNVTVTNLKLDGANTFGVYGINGNNPIIVDNVITNVGKAIGITAARGVQVLRNDISWCMENGICVSSKVKNNVVIYGNKLRWIGPRDGMFAKFHPENGWGIFAFAYDTCLVANNDIMHTATGSINVGGGGTSTSSYGLIVENNLCDSAGYWLSDQGIIYMYDTINTPFRHRVFRNNICFNGIGNTNATNLISELFSGIYLDGQTSFDSVYNNTIKYVPRRGIIINEGLNVYVFNNTVVGATTSLLFSRYGIRTDTTCGRVPDLKHRDSIYVNIHDNIFYGFNNTAQIYYLDAWLQGRTIPQALTRVGIINNNWYNEVDDPKWKVEAYSNYPYPGRPGCPAVGAVGVSYPAMDLITWQTNSGKDLSSSSVADHTDEDVLLLYNWSDKVVFRTLTAQYKTKAGTLSPNVVTLQPFSSELLFYYDELDTSPTLPLKGIIFINEN